MYKNCDLLALNKSSMLVMTYTIDISGMLSGCGVSLRGRILLHEICFVWG